MTIVLDKLLGIRVTSLLQSAKTFRVRNFLIGHFFGYIFFRAVAKTRCTLLEYGQSKVKGRIESQTSTTEAE